MIDAKDIKQIGQGSAINVNWELVSHCQFKCTYCYYGPHKSNTNYSTLGKIILKKLSTISAPTKITLLGGEPTLHPDFHEVVNALHKIKHVEEINIVTNFEMPLEFWTQLTPYADKIKVVISFHPEYPQRDAFDKIQSLQDLLKLDLVFVVHNNLKFLPRLNEYFDHLRAKIKDHVTFNFVPVHESIEGQNKYVPYPDEIKEFLKIVQNYALTKDNFETASILLINDQWQLTPKFELLNKSLNRLKGWKCDLRAFIIHEDGQVSRACTSSKKHILLEDFSGKTITCPFNICECDDYWNFPKRPN